MGALRTRRRTETDDPACAPAMLRCHSQTRQAAKLSEEHELSRIRSELDNVVRELRQLRQALLALTQVVASRK